MNAETPITLTVPYHAVPSLLRMAIIDINPELHALWVRAFDKAVAEAREAEEPDPWRYEPPPATSWRTATPSARVRQQLEEGHDSVVEVLPEPYDVFAVYADKFPDPSELIPLRRRRWMRTAIRTDYCGGHLTRMVTDWVYLVREEA